MWDAYSQTLAMEGILLHHRERQHRLFWSWAALAGLLSSAQQHTAQRLWTLNPP